MRGFRWAVYETDDGRLFGLLVDASRTDDANRGLSSTGAELTNPLPRGWRPRRVVGIDPEGNVRYARVGRLDAPLWTGAATAFVVEANDGTTPSATVIGRQQERLRQPQP